MLILAIDTAAAACTTCLWRGGQVIDEIVVRQNRGHGEILVPQIQELLAQSGFTFQDLGRVAVTRGPGSFTGLRVGLATARAIGLGTGIPVSGVSTLEALALAAREADPADTYLAALQTKRGDLYTQLFTEADAEPARIRSADETKDLARDKQARIVGDAASFLTDHLGPSSGLIFSDPDVPPGWAIAELGAAQETPQPPMPLYLRDAEAKLPSQGGRLRP